ncbi:SUN domain-containing ossification factor-like isoform X1 [Asterias amurensis]|uniref:SUN domain-containing ossification factor-like isoform X1 n=1 Tax=Asterias amurensis TaxID=7602 RepID=UPI003AB77BFD
MVPFWFQGARRILLAVLLLCVCRQSVTETAHNQEDNKPNEDVDKQPAGNVQQHQQQQDVNNHNIDQQVGEVDAKPAGETQTPSSSPPADRGAPRAGSNEDEPKARRGWAELPNDEGGPDHGMKDEDQESLPNEPIAGGGTFQGTVGQVIELPYIKKSTEEELSSDEEQLVGLVPGTDSDIIQEDNVPEAAEGVSSPESIQDLGKDSDGTAAIDSGLLSPNEEEVPGLEGEPDTRTEQINREASSEKLNNLAASQSTDSIEEAEEESSSQPPKSEDDASLEVKEDPAEAVIQGDATGVDTETDPSSKLVEGASQGEDSNKEAIATDSEAVEEDLQDVVKEEQHKGVSLEIFKDTDSEIEVTPDSQLDEVKENLGEERTVDGEEKVEDKDAVLERDIGEQGKDQAPGLVKEEDAVKEDGKTPTPSKKEEVEDMPSFDEWKQKMLEEEKERQQGQAGQGAVVPPPRPFSLTENSKNHASSDCGAKILNVNKGAQNAPAILQSNRDVYTLNPCTANIWFSVELCEPIQVKHLEIANYELFSSVPKSFRVSISDRFPTREWRQIGTFHAREERSLQSFPVHEEQMFAKYMKIEMLTFFGSEHYCPLSILRVFGTSMVEEIDDENIPEHGLNGETEVLPAHPAQVHEDDNSSLLQSAKGLVRNIMNVITGNGNNKAAPHCENENSSCGVGDKMLPCLPGEEPDKENATLSMMDKSQGSSQCLFRSMFDFSVDNKWFQKECSGSRWCFSPNYGQHFQDCCIKDIYTSSHSINSFLYCKDAMHLPLYRSVRTQKPLVVSKNLLLESHEETLHVRDSKTKYQRHIDVEVEVTSVKSEKDHLRRADQDDKDPAKEGVKPSGASTAIPSKPIKRHTESQLKPSSSPPAVKAVSATPTPALTTTCGMLPSDHPKIQTIPPTPIQPTIAQRGNEVQGESGAIIVEPDPGKGTEAGRQQEVEEKPSQEEVKLPVLDLDEDQELEDTLVKTLDEIPTPMEPKAPSDTAALNDIRADPLNLPDESRKADSTGKDPSTKTATPDEAAKTMKAEPVLKSPETVKPDSSGKGSKLPLESGGTGAGIGSMGATQKESVFMRLNNRIKSLEFNMSLSSRYLEELSQRYRKQMDEMQKAFNKTVQTLTDNAQKAEEKDLKQQEYITRLEGQMSEVMSSMETTTHRLDSLHREVIERHLFLMFLEILLMCFLFLICIRRIRKERRKLEVTIPSLIKANDSGGRRQSLPTAKSKDLRNNNVLPGGRPRRRTVSGGSCDDLLIIGPTLPIKKTDAPPPPPPPRNKPKAKPRHRSTSKSSSTSGLHKNRSHLPPNKPSIMSPAGLLFRGSALKRDRASPELPTMPLHRTFSAENLKSRVEEVKGGAPPMKQHSKAGGKNAGKKHGLWMRR